MASIASIAAIVGPLAMTQALAFGAEHGEPGGAFLLAFLLVTGALLIVIFGVVRRKVRGRHERTHFAAPDGVDAGLARDSARGGRWCCCTACSPTPTPTGSASAMPPRSPARGFRVIMPDLRGHGTSARPHEASAYPPDVLATRRAGADRPSRARRLRSRRLFAGRADGGPDGGARARGRAGWSSPAWGSRGCSTPAPARRISRRS